MKEYIVRHLKDDGTEGAVIGTAPDVDRARALGDEQAADPDYPWYTISRDGKHVETVRVYPHGVYDPERDGVPSPFPAGRALWPRPVDRRHLKENREAMQDHDPPL